MLKLQGKKVLVMGIGLNGGGLAAIKFACRHGAEVTATDLKDSNSLHSTLKSLQEFNVNYVLGQHREKDFIDADLVIKSPAIAASNPLLKLAKRVESDISIFLQLRPEQPIYAVTGTKGKSTVSTLLAAMLRRGNQNTKLGGNVGCSPLDFIDQLDRETAVVLELSSWQLHDLGHSGLLSPRVAIICNIMPDHLNHYSSFADYAQDKLLIYQHIKPENWVILPKATVDDVFQPAGHANMMIGRTKLMPM